MKFIPRDNDQQQAHVNPTEETELLFEESTSERHNKTNEADGIECKADNSVIGSERK
jgi:hypothetical protein